MEMLRNITAGSTAASNPLLKSLLGPTASEADYVALAKEAESVWKMMDDLAENDPEGYQAFVRYTAKAAREEVDRGRDPHVEGLSPALVLEAQAQQAAGDSAAGPSSSAAPQMTRVVWGPRAVARVHIWAANDASGVPPPYVGSTPLADCQQPPRSWWGLAIPLAEYKPASTWAGPVPVHHFHVACHVSVVRMVASGGQPVVRAAFLEAVSQFVEGEHRLELSRTVRTLQVHREAVSEAEVKVLVAAQERHTRAGASLEDAAGAAPSLPKGLLQDLRSLGYSAPAGAKPQGSATAAGSAASRGPNVKKALIEELN